MLPVEQLRHGEAERQGKPGGMRLVNSEWKRGGGLLLVHIMCDRKHDF